MKKYTIAVVGSGYVGTTTAALLAMAGHSVTAIDVDSAKVDAINQGRAPFYEFGLDALIERAVKEGRLKGAASTEAIGKADIVFSSVGTPATPDGSPDLTFVDQVASTVQAQAKKGAIFVQKSTVPVGTGARLSALMPNQTYVSNPEFLRESTAVLDSLQQERIVVGCDDAESQQTLFALFESVLAAREAIARQAGVSLGTDWKPPQEIATSIASAELIKVSANAFLALKISFANSVAMLADSTGADVTEVLNGVGSDERIGHRFLQAGRGFGGGCFPKDVEGLIHAANEHGADASIMKAAAVINNAMPDYIVEKAMEHIEGKRVAILGLSFKSGTSDLRRSPSIRLANLCAKSAAHSTVFDPQAAKEELAPQLLGTIEVCDSLAAAIAGVDTIVIATDWPEFVELDVSALDDSVTAIVDGMNCLDKQRVASQGLHYIGVGRQSV